MTSSTGRATFTPANAPVTVNNGNQPGGAGLTWTSVVRSNTQRGTSEIWRALAPSPLNGVSVSASLSKSVASSITVISFSGVDATSADGASAIGATKPANGPSGAPTASLVTTRANSLVVGVGNDYDSPILRTAGPNQVLVHQFLPGVGDTYWVQRQSATTPLSGTNVTINDTAPTGDRYNLAICEILAAPCSLRNGPFRSEASEKSLSLFHRPDTGLASVPLVTTQLLTLSH
jgi:hypothetical protein